MAYIELHGEMPHHPKTTLVMRELKIPRAQAVGHLACIWAHMIHSSPSGLLRREIIEAAAEWEGDEGLLIAALLKHRWLDAVDDGTVRIHDVEEYTRQYQKAKTDYQKKLARSAEEAQKKRVLRAEDAVKGREVTGTEENRPDKGSCSEPGTAPASDPVLFESECPQELVGLVLYEKDMKLRKAWPKLFPALVIGHPGVDVAAEIRKAHAWEIGNPTRIKKDRPRFLTMWVGKTQDKAPMNGTAKPSAIAAPSVWTAEKGGKRDF